MKLTKGIISREEALKISPDYVIYAEGDWRKYDAVEEEFAKLKRGQAVLAYNDGEFVLAKVSSINHNDIRAIDGPVVRVSNGEYSWRVDGNGMVFPVKAT